MQTRVYTDKINIDNNSTKEFWQKRANNINNLQTVLLGSDNTGSEQNIRNENEKRIVEKIIEKIQNPGILDIGCGIGRWAENLQNKFEYYVGVDFSEGILMMKIFQIFLKHLGKFLLNIYIFRNPLV